MPILSFFFGLVQYYLFISWFGAEDGLDGYLILPIVCGHKLYFHRLDLRELRILPVEEGGQLVVLIQNTPTSIKSFLGLLIGVSTEQTVHLLLSIQSHCQQIVKSGGAAFNDRLFDLLTLNGLDELSLELCRCQLKPASPVVAGSRLVRAAPETCAAVAEARVEEEPLQLLQLRRRAAAAPCQLTSRQKTRHLTRTV